jgi:hypothetical protein
MVSGWWLLVALWVGACIGFLVATALTVSKSQSPDELDIQPPGPLAHRRH